VPKTARKGKGNQVASSGHLISPPATGLENIRKNERGLFAFQKRDSLNMMRVWKHVNGTSTRQGVL